MKRLSGLCLALVLIIDLAWSQACTPAKEIHAVDQADVPETVSARRD